LYGLVFWELEKTLIAWVGMLALQLVTAAVAFRFDRESPRPLWRLPLQQFAYRQLMYLVLMQSATTALTGGRLRWHKLQRAGLAPRAELGRPPARVALEWEPVAPAVDTWPPTIDRERPTLHPATVRSSTPPVPALMGSDPEDLPSAGSPPGGGSGPV